MSSASTDQNGLPGPPRQRVQVLLASGLALAALLSLAWWLFRPPVQPQERPLEPARQAVPPSAPRAEALLGPLSAGPATANPSAIRPAQKGLASRAAAEQEPSVLIAGRVLAGERVLANARVFLRTERADRASGLFGPPPTPLASTLSDAAGQYRLRLSAELAVQKLVVGAAHPQHPPAFLRLRLDEGESERLGCDLKLSAGISARGRVLRAADLQPLADQVVVLCNNSFLGNQTWLSSTWELGRIPQQPTRSDFCRRVLGRTDAEGRFTIGPVLDDNSIPQPFDPEGRWFFFRQPNLDPDEWTFFARPALRLSVRAVDESDGSPLSEVSYSWLREDAKGGLSQLGRCRSSGSSVSMSTHRKSKFLEASKVLVAAPGYGSRLFNLPEWQSEDPLEVLTVALPRIAWASVEISLRDASGAPYPLPEVQIQHTRCAPDARLETMQKLGMGSRRLLAADPPGSHRYRTRMAAGRQRLAVTLPGQLLSLRDAARTVTLSSEEPNELVFQLPPAGILQIEPESDALRDGAKPMRLYLRTPDRPSRYQLLFPKRFPFRLLISSGEGSAVLTSGPLRPDHPGEFEFRMLPGQVFVWRP